MIKELTDTEYKSTMTGKMVDITETAELLWTFGRMYKN